MIRSISSRLFYLLGPNSRPRKTALRITRVNRVARTAVGAGATDGIVRRAAAMSFGHGKASLVCSLRDADLAVNAVKGRAAATGATVRDVRTVDSGRSASSFH